MRYCRLIVFLLSLVAIDNSLYAQGTSVEWGRPVTYADFTAKPTKSDTAAANISVTIMLGYARKKDGSLKFKVAAVMDRDESWIRDQFRNAEILSHEQGHFDIAHIFARKLEADLKTKRYTIADVSELNTLYDQFLEKMNVLQMQYDRETRGGLDLKAQARWRKYIHSEINGVAAPKGL